MSKRGDILVENTLFIILNLIFVAMLMLFIFRQGEGAVVLEQVYAKQIALLIDAATPGMTIKLNMAKAKTLAEKNGLDFKDVVEIKGDNVLVKLGQNSGYEYSFFNDVDVSAYPDGDEMNYVIKINGYNKEDEEIRS